MSVDKARIKAFGSFDDCVYGVRSDSFRVSRSLERKCVQCVTAGDPRGPRAICFVELHPSSPPTPRLQR